MAKRNRRGVLNQIIEDPIEETTKEEVVENEPLIVDLKTEAPEVQEEKLLTEEEVVAQEEFIEELPEEVFFSAPVPDEMGEITEFPVEKSEPCTCEEPCQDPCVCEEPVKVEEILPEPKVEEKPAATYLNWKMAKRV